MPLVKREVCARGDNCKMKVVLATLLRYSF